jgi:aspartyl-tRNA(Asn)/glutamyl-tRNA(Gln) amidotransferase subunit A
VRRPVLPLARRQGLHLLLPAILPLLAPGGAEAAAGPQPPQPSAPPTCPQRIAAALERILARTLVAETAPLLNAFQTLNASALAQAAELDRRLAERESPGPLHWLPLAVKDNVDSFDLPMMVGFLALLGNQPVADAMVLARLRAAGAVLVGKDGHGRVRFRHPGPLGGRRSGGQCREPVDERRGILRRFGRAVGPGSCPWPWAVTTAVRCACSPSTTGR